MPILSRTNKNNTLRILKFEAIEQQSLGLVGVSRGNLWQCADVLAEGSNIGELVQEIFVESIDHATSE